jgi:anthranilate synthase/indole-3-glycerol phosphate synthase/phosphoribosylanthranilate isomerase
MALAAEFKRMSPSKGLIAPPNLRAGEQAALYAGAGASVISVLTEGRWFGGSLADLTEARLADRPRNGRRRRPAILRKDFVFSEYQIAEASAHGADSVLLIVATTPSDVLGKLIHYARNVVGMEPLVEVHAPDELDVALAAGARVIGVNNRNLHTFQLDLGCAERVAGELARRGLGYRHDDVVVAGGDGDDGGGGQRGRRISLCALSGMSTSHDVDRYRRAGVGMCLIGESLMRSADPMAAIRGLCLDPADYIRASSSDGSGGGSGGGGGVGAGGAYVAGTRIVKVCGVTNPVDAVVACRAGANLIGLIFAEKSGRRVTSFDAAVEIVNAVRGFGERSDRIAFVVDYDDNEGRSSRVGADAVPALVARARELERVASSRRPLVVGVFQNQDPGYVKDAVEKCGLDMVQLHGSEGMAASNWRNFGVPALRVVDIELGAPDDDGDGGGGGGRAAGGSSTSSPSDVIASAILGRLTSDPFAILLDTSIKGGGGGTGRAFDWTIAESIQNMGLPVMIAGGLSPENVGEAVGGVRPWGVDVAGGVEVRPGVKDHDKVRRFVSGARTAAAEADKGF